jgi:hypothetical protein
VRCKARERGFAQKRLNCKKKKCIVLAANIFPYLFPAFYRFLRVLCKAAMRRSVSYSQVSG